MSKYTEAIELEETPMQTLARNTAERIDEEIHMAITKAIRIKVDKDTIIKALQIADRLEHVDFTKHKKHYHYNIGDSEWDSGYEIGFINGYNQALTDIRGDAE